MCVYWTENNLLKNKITFTQKSFSVENWETLNIQNVLLLDRIVKECPPSEECAGCSTSIALEWSERSYRLQPV